MSKITARKYRGDDAYSWAVFIDGVPMVTGLSKREVPHYKKQAAEILQDRSRRASMAASTDHSASAPRVTS